MVRLFVGAYVMNMFALSTVLMFIMIVLGRFRMCLRWSVGLRLGFAELGFAELGFAELDDGMYDFYGVFFI